MRQTKTHIKDTVMVEWGKYVKVDHEVTFIQSSERTFDDHPIYDVKVGDVFIGKIERASIAHHTTYKGTRIRRDFKPRLQFRESVSALNPHRPLWQDTRQRVARDMVAKAIRDGRLQ